MAAKGSLPLRHSAFSTFSFPASSSCSDFQWRGFSSRVSIALAGFCPELKGYLSAFKALSKDCCRACPKNVFLFPQNCSFPPSLLECLTIVEVCSGDANSKWKRAHQSYRSLDHGIVLSHIYLISFYCQLPAILPLYPRMCIIKWFSLSY